MTFGETDDADHATLLDRSSQHRRLRLAQRVGDVRDLEVVAHVGLVGAEPQQAFLHVEARKGHRQIDVEELLPDLHPQAFDEAEHILLGAERHLDVELRDLHHAVRAQILIAQAAGDLVVASDAGDHEQLLELLR